MLDGPVGSSRLLHLLYGGSLLLAFSLFMHTLAMPGQYYQLCPLPPIYCPPIGAGLGAGAIYIPTVADIAHYSQKRRPLAMTLVASGSSVGAIIHPIMLNNPSSGFATAARANAGHDRRTAPHPVLADAHQAGVAEEHDRLVGRGAQFHRSPRIHCMSSLRWGGLDLLPLSYVLACRTFFPNVLLTFVMGFYFPLFYLQLDALTHGLDNSFSFYALLWASAPGFVVNRLGVEKILVASIFVCAVLILSMFALKTVASVIAIAIIHGFPAGVYITLLAPWLAVLADDISELGYVFLLPCLLGSAPQTPCKARMGVAFFFCGIMSLIGTPIEGSLLTGNYIWWRPAVFGGVMGFVGFDFYITSLILLRRRRRRHPLAVIESPRASDCSERQMYSLAVSRLSKAERVIVLYLALATIQLFAVQSHTY
ncbi:hypothetical protein C8Q74DRAFT_1450190 [Fomes fomentarius]|nr:hypothetical protein C8Q74DRAFT_1450190 [Fomes fomentarius]